jgi:hypothetical protein
MSEIWKLKEGVVMSQEATADVVKMACALKSLSAYSSMACEDEDAPADLQAIVDEGLTSMQKIFEW